jgi:uncharacterized protein
MKCPRCETSPLDERDRDGITIDVCQQCRGIWLDRGELERLVARTLEGEEDSARRSDHDRDHDHDDDDHRDRSRHYAEHHGHEDSGYAEGRSRKRRWYESLTNILD